MITAATRRGLPGSCGGRGPLNDALPILPEYVAALLPGFGNGNRPPGHPSIAEPRVFIRRTDTPLPPLVPSPGPLLSW